MYPNTTWELLTAGKYIQSGNTALQTGGNNSVNILKENLPNTKLQVENFNLTRGTMDITGKLGSVYGEPIGNGHHFPSGAFYGTDGHAKSTPAGWDINGTYAFQASRAWTGATSNASPYTETLGSGTPLTIQPAYITLKFWKRLS